MRIIATEEHFVSPAYLDGPGRGLKQMLLGQSFLGQRVLDGLLDVGAGRIAEMDKAGVSAHVISLTAPGVEQLEPAEAVETARETNDCLAGAMKAYPTRLFGLAAIATPDPKAGARELELRIKQGFKGGVINGHSRGRYLDDKFYWPVFEAAESIDAPIYLHPTMLQKPVMEALYSGLPKGLDFALAGPAWGFHIDTALHLLRMIVGGVFDRFPNLQIVIGHLGECLPFMIQRLDAKLPPNATGLARTVGAYLRENVHYSTADFNYPAAFANLLAEVGIERIMFSADHPYGSMAEGRAFLDQLPLNATDKERMAFRNAEKLFKL